MSLIKAIRAQLGLSNTAANNFTLDASADNGTIKLARGNAGATTQDILTVDASGNVNFPVTKAIETPVKSALNASGSAPVYGCRAWCVFVGSTGAVSAGGNISVVRNSVGNYTIAFTTALEDANYSVALSADGGSTNYETFIVTTRASGSFVLLHYVGGTLSDASNYSIAVFR